MNDLSGLNWNTQSSNSAKPPPQYPSTLHASPSPNISRGPSPLSAQQSGNSANNGARSSSTSKAATNDSFSNLLSSTTSKQTGTLTLQERQKQLLAEKARQAAEQNKDSSQVYNANDAHFWEGLGSGRGTPAPPESQQKGIEDEEDILAAFNASAPVDSSSHFPPPSSGDDMLGEPISTIPQRQYKSPAPQLNSQASATTFEDDDDPFGLGQMAASRPAGRTGQPSSAAIDDEDVLGLLGKPVEEAKAPKSDLPPPMDDGFAPGSSINPTDRALAELVDMGFAPDKAKEALAQTSTGTDVQGAVGWLLNQAHQESRSRSRPTQGEERRATEAGMGSGSQRRESKADDSEATTSWMKRQNGNSRNDSRSPVGGQKDAAQYATDLSSTIFKSANAFWKTSQKRVQKVVAEYQHEGDKSQPRWMRNGQTSEEAENAPSVTPVDEHRAATVGSKNVTDEAILLETPRSPPPSRPSRQNNQNSQPPRNTPCSRERPPLVPNEVSTERPTSRSSQPPSQRPESRPQAAFVRPVERLSRQAVEEQSSQVYISPARRKKPQAPKPAEPVEPDQTLDIFSSQQPPVPSKQPPALSAPASRSSKPPTPSQPRPKVPPRQAPQVSSDVLSTSALHRQKGTEAFKRGDYSDAHTHYTNALTPLPDGHPIVIILRCNRALTNIKVGDPKAAIVDADSAIAIVGSSQGEGETIFLGDTEGEKPMKEFYGKALMRKAEALENMEKWAEAGKVWRQAVEAGVGGAISIQGRNRCDKAAGKEDPGVRSTTAARKPAPKSRPAPAKKSALDDLNGTGTESEAVKRLRAQNEATAAASDEQFALADTVDARLNDWKGGKSDNLRALLASLDAVLWADAGWSKVGMSDLVMPNRVKIVYMKAIAKVHPDKIPTNATTEQRMVSASVFATLNEAWDKFKKDNGL